MRKRLTLLAAAACLLALGLRAQDYDKLGARLEEYLSALEGESAAVQNAEADFLIGSCQDSLVRQYVALKVYDHYLQSPIMGDEAVAVHVAEKWFLSGAVPMHSDGDLLNAQVFVMFNKNALIGMQAPQVTLRDTLGREVRIPASGGYSAIYFYDTSCSTCRAETPRLRQLMQEGTYPLTVYAVNVGDVGEAWEQYRAQLPGAVHLWDPEHESDWQLQYGVLQTPKLYLLDPSGTILGRGLDVQALRILLEKAFSAAPYTYGEPARMESYSALFHSCGDTLKVADILEVAACLAARTLGEGNVPAYKQTMGDLLYYLFSQRTEVCREALGPFAEQYILAHDFWNAVEDRTQVLPLARLVQELGSRSPVGSPVPEVQVPGTLRRKGCLFAPASRTGTFSLRSLKGDPAYVVFYSPGCTSCQETLSAVDALVKGNRKVRVLLVNMDGLFTDGSSGGSSDGSSGGSSGGGPDTAALLLESFDLSTLPFVLELDKDGTVLRRYVQLSPI